MALFAAAVPTFVLNRRLTVTAMDAGDEIRRLRLATGMSQKKFADAMDVSRSGISAMERGVTPPTADLLRRAERLAAERDSNSMTKAESPAATSHSAECAEPEDAAQEASADSRPERIGLGGTSADPKEAGAGSDTDHELARLRDAVERLTQEIRTDGRSLPNPQDSMNREPEVHRRLGVLTKIAAAAAIAYGTAGALVLTGLLARHGLPPVLSLMGGFAADAGQWLMGLVPFV